MLANLQRHSVAQSRLGVRLEGSIAQYDPHEWDALVSDSNFYNSHGWISGLEQSLGPSEILSVSGPNGLLSACALWEGDKHSPLFHAPSLFEGMEGPWDKPFLWGGARRSTHNEPVCGRGPRRGEALRLLLRAGIDCAAERAYAGFIMPYMPVREAIEMAQGEPRVRILLHDAEANQPVFKGGFQEAIANFKKRNRVNARAEWRAFEKLGNIVLWQRLTPDLEESVASLIAANRQKYGASQGCEWMRRLFRGQRDSRVIKAAVVALAMNGDRITAATVFYRFGRVLHPRFFGCDYSWPDNDFRYFVLSYYAATDYAADQGIDRIQLSIAALDAKIKRGAKINPLVAVVGLCDGAIGKREAARHNQASLRKYKTRFGKYMESDWAVMEP